MPGTNLFFDSSALFAGMASRTGAARALLLLSEAGLVMISVSEQVIVETEQALARKAPQALAVFRQALRQSGLRIVRKPSRRLVAKHADIIAHAADVPIVAAAMQADVGFLVTLSRRHFIDDPRVAERSDLRIGTPGDALAWVQGRWGSAEC
jgi:predicted nucleic acid-binding protein